MRVAAGFDGSRSSDWTALRLETLDGYRFTPTYGPDQRPTFWDPAEWPEGRIPRGEVKAAVDEVFRTYKVARMYVDPRHWETQADEWATQHGDEVVIQWPTNQIGRMHPALLRYREDLAEKVTTHSPDEVMKVHALAARRIAKPGERFILGKPSENQKIDLLMADVLAHEAAADMRAAGWTAEPVDSRMIVLD
jgi:phage terminase large subunit-like protein